MNRIEASWARDVAPVCEGALARRYPFVSPGDTSAGRDVTTQDFSSFFGPNGIMDKFVGGNLATVTVPGADGRLTLSSQNGVSLGLPNQALAQINRARQIRTLFFSPDGNLLVRFWLTPSYLDPRLLSATLQSDQIRMEYRHEPPRATQFVWPATGEGGASFSIRTIGGDVDRIQYDGVWAIFKLLQSASGVLNGNPARQILSFKLGDYLTSYQLRADSVSNPFADGDFASFRCVPRL